MSSVDSSEPMGGSGGITFATGPEGQFAFRPRQLIVRGDRARAIVRERFRIPAEQRDDDDGDGDFLIMLPEGVDPLSVAADLADDGFLAEPNYVLFAHGMKVNTMPGDSLKSTPLWGNPLWGNPLWGNPLWGNPLWGNPLWGNPLWGNPADGEALYFDQYQMTNYRPSTARPAKEPVPKPLDWGSNPRGDPTVLILDSGLAAQQTGLTPAGWLPPYLGFLKGTPQADRDVPWSNLPPPTKTNDFGALDPVAGHGTFVAGIIERLAPGRNITICKVVHPLGDTDSWTVENRILDLIKANLVHDHTILNLSFGGHAADLKPGEMWVLARAVRKVTDRKAVIVASAGNDATARKTYPACLRGVIGVAGLGPNGPAPFTNYGPWVRACAPGTNLVSSFFTGFDGPINIGPAAIDPDRFDGWARWSGTSFAAPVVVAALAREMIRTNRTAEEAVKQVIDAPGLLSLPLLGTVINIA